MAALYQIVKIFLLNMGQLMFSRSENTFFRTAFAAAKLIFFTASACTKIISRNFFCCTVLFILIKIKLNRSFINFSLYIQLFGDSFSLFFRILNSKLNNLKCFDCVKFNICNQLREKVKTLLLIFNQWIFLIISS